MLPHLLDYRLHIDSDCVGQLWLLGFDQHFGQNIISFRNKVLGLLEEVKNEQVLSDNVVADGVLSQNLVVEVYFGLVSALVLG